MPPVAQKEINGQTLSYQIFGSGKIGLVIEMGLGAVMGEWQQLAQRFSGRHAVLLYQRGRNTGVARTPQNIAEECRALLCALPCEEKVVLLSHSQGGLYAQQFARLYPELIRGVVLLDPLSANDSVYKTEFPSPKEQRMTGFDKSENFRIMEKLASLHLGFVIKALMRKAPPFYYYDGFSRQCSADILQELTRPELHRAALEEYRLAHEASAVAGLRERADFPGVPLALVTHGSDFEMREIMEFGRTTEAFARRVEELWQSLMREYLSFSDCTLHLRAQQSGHYLHLTEPERVEEALAWVEEASR